MKTVGTGWGARLLLFWATTLLGLGSAAGWAQSVTFSPSAAVFSDTVTVALSGAGSGQQIRYVVASGAEAASAEVTSASPIYTGPITVTGTTLIRAAVFGGGASALGRVTSGYYLKRHPDLSAFDTALPVLVLDDLGAGPLEPDEVNHASWLFGFAPDDASTFQAGADFATPLDLRVRGSSSADFPKKGYNARLRDAAGRGRAFPIFDLPAYERWALVAPWAFDPGFINNAFVYELSNRIGRWAPRTRLVETFFNAAGDDLAADDYAGIYVVTDRIRIEPGRVAIEALDEDDAAEPAITGGYILQINPPDPGDISWLTERGVPVEGPSEIILVEPDAEDVTPAQENYIKTYVQAMEDALHADRAANFAQRSYLDYIDRSSWVDHHILNVLVNNPDALHRSAYFTKPRDGRMQAGPVWDFDRAIGGVWDDRTATVDTWSGVNGAVDVWRTGWWEVLAADPDFVQEWIDRWQGLRRNEFSTEALTGLAQGLSNGVGNDAATRDVERWPDSASPFGSYQAHIDHLKSWLTQRVAWIDTQFVAAPTATVQGEFVTFAPPEGALLAYTVDGSDPRASGGAAAGDVQMHAGPLTLPATVNARVRSYDPTPRDQDPSSPWSAPAETVNSSPASAPGRIINLSSKAHLGAADDSLIIGFVVANAPAKRYLVRAVGPGLDVFGEPATLDDPRLQVVSTAGVTLAQNSDWGLDVSAGQLPAVAQSVGAFPLEAGSADAATLLEIGSGAFTVQIATAGEESGTVLGELYEADPAGRTANVSIRGRASAEQPLIGGFVIAGGSNRVLIRGVGPTLRDFGVEDAAGDPMLLVRSSGAVIATNDSWLSGANANAVEEASRQVGAFPLPAGSQDAAVVLSLPAGAYTVEVKPAGEPGAILLEVYDLP